MNIRVLTDVEVIERFGWAWAAEMTRQYPHTTLEHNQRLAEAASLTSTNRDLVERRYLLGDRDVVLPAEFATVFSELARVAGRGWRG